MAITGASTPSSPRIAATIPSTSPTKPSTSPDRSAADVYIPITEGGSTKSTFVSRAAR